MRKIPKDVPISILVGDVSILALVGLVAIVAIIIVLLNTNIVLLNTNSLTTARFSEDTFIGQAISLISGKNCGTTQQAICKQQQNRCATMKGTWEGDCRKCSIKCSILPKKK